METTQVTGGLRLSSSLAGGQLLYTNSPRANTAFKFEPASFELRLKALDTSQIRYPATRLTIETGPAGAKPWTQAEYSGADLQSEISLACAPAGSPPPPGPLNLEVKVKETASGSVLLAGQLPLSVAWIGHSGFDPAVNGYNFVNSAGVYGPVSLDRAIFDRTFTLVLGREKFFRKMYRDILGATLDEKGPIPGTAPLSSGLCTGMIRSTLAFYLSKANPPARDLQPTGETLNTIKFYHGRQLSDRALLQAVGWVLRGGPRKVFETFKQEVLSGNRDPLAFDIGIATWGRKDFFKAIQSEGHTVVPYAFRQSEPDTGEIFIYNPNNPASQDDYGYANAPAGQENRLAGHVIRFDLAKNTYYYSDHYQSVRPNGDATTIVAVHQSAYEQGRSAILASLANRFI